MTEDFNWDEYTNNGEYMTFVNVGDSIVGELLAVRKGKDFNGNPCPELLIRDDEGLERTVTAGQVMLKSKLADVKPQVGQRIAITYSGVGTAQPGKAPAKLFDVATGQPQTSTPAAPNTPQSVSAGDLL